MSHPHLIFVYGTLKRGLCRSHFLAGQLFLGAARTLSMYRMFNCGTYPGLTVHSDGLSILGELWAVDASCLARLDREEGVSDGLFGRYAIEMEGPVPECNSGDVIEAYFYLRTVAGFSDCGTVWID